MNTLKIPTHLSLSLSLSLPSFLSLSLSTPSLLISLSLSLFSLHSSLSPSIDSIIQIVEDGIRNILYTRSEKGNIRVCPGTHVHSPHHSYYHCNIIACLSVHVQCIYTYMCNVYIHTCILLRNVQFIQQDYMLALVYNNNCVRII